MWNSIILCSKAQLWGSGGPEHDLGDSTNSRKVRLNSGVLMKIAQAFCFGRQAAAHLTGSWTDPGALAHRSRRDIGEGGADSMCG